MGTLGSGGASGFAYKGRAYLATSGSILPRRRPAVREEETSPWKEDTLALTGRWGLARKGGRTASLSWAGCGEDELGPWGKK